MRRKNHIYSQWESLAKKHKGRPEASWGDYNMVSLEVAALGSQIEEGDAVLDIGCANGHATVLQIKHKPKSITAVDYCKEMIKQARKHKAISNTKD